MSRFEGLSEELSSVSAMCSELRRLLDEPGQYDEEVKQGIIERIELIENSALESLRIISEEEGAVEDEEEEHRSPAESRVDVLQELMIERVVELLGEELDETVSEMVAADPEIEPELLYPGRNANRGGKLSAYIEGVKERIREMRLGTRTVVDLPKYIWWNQELELLKRVSRKLKKKYRLSKRDHFYHLTFLVIKEYYRGRISFYKQISWDTFVGKDQDGLVSN